MVIVLEAERVGGRAPQLQVISALLLHVPRAAC